MAVNLRSETVGKELSGEQSLTQVCEKSWSWSRIKYASFIIIPASSTTLQPLGCVSVCIIYLYNVIWEMLSIILFASYFIVMLYML
jgi:hypothetical protein